MNEQQGLVAILDALGAARYGRDEIGSFLKSRKRVIGILKDEAYAKEARGLIKPRSLTVFTFNDTVLITYQTEATPTIVEVKRFLFLLRRFAVESLSAGILFRGSVSLGSFYVARSSNTVMGAAVTDAAAWYDATEWVGINLTPHASMVVQSLIEHSGEDVDHLLIDYEVPFKNQPAMKLKAVNWPKGFFVPGVTPVADSESERGTLLKLLAAQGIPRGAEAKHINTVAFFDCCVERRAARKASPKQ